MTAILALLAFSIALTLWLSRKPRRTEVVPPTRHQREESWRARFMAESDDYLTTAVRGATAKRRLLQECRNSQARSVLSEIARRAGDRIPPPTLRAIQHYGVGPRTRCDIAVLPLTSSKPEPKTIVVRRRPKLALAR